MKKVMKIVFLDAATMGEISFEPVAVLGELVCYDSSTPQEALERVSDCDVMIVNKVKVTPELIDAATNLKLICESATGVNNIDVAYAASKGIPVKNVVGYSTTTVVQMTFMHILSLCGHAQYFDRYVKEGTYSGSGMFTDAGKCWWELSGKTMGVIGLGNIGLRVAKVAEAFGMNVCYYSTSGTSHNKDYPSVSLEQLLSESDIVSVHAPLNERTSGLIAMPQLKMMKPTAYLINMGRGGIVVENDLAEAVDAGIIAGAGLDVFEVEPLPADNCFLKMAHPERMSLTPHVGWASEQARARLLAQVAENIKDTLLK